MVTLPDEPEFFAHQLTFSVVGVQEAIVEEENEAKLAEEKKDEEKKEEKEKSPAKEKETIFRQF